MFSIRKNLIGIDIGTKTVKMCEVNLDNKNNATLTSLGVSGTPTGQIVNGVISKTQDMAKVIKDMVANSNTRRRSVCTSVWGSDTITRRIINPGELDIDIIREEAALHIPFSLDDVNLQFQKVENTDQDAILLFAVNKSLIMGYVETLSLAGLRCNVIDTVATALANCYTHNYDVNIGEIVAILDIGEQSTSLVILESGEIAFTKDIEFGGYNYTYSLYEQLASNGSSLAEMESLKKNDPPVDEVLPIIQATHDTLIEKVGNYLDYYASSMDGGAINKLYLTGGSSLVYGLKDHVGKALGEKVEVEIFDPFKRVGFDEKMFTQEKIDNLKPYASVSLGLSLRRVGDD